MGMNYYKITRGETDEQKGLHIGKKSCGWQFNFHGFPELGIVSVEDWKKQIVGDEIIVDGNGEEFTWERFEAEVLFGGEGQNEFDHFAEEAWLSSSEDEWHYTLTEVSVAGVSAAYRHTMENAKENIYIERYIWQDDLTSYQFITGEWS